MENIENFKKIFFIFFLFVFSCFLLGYYFGCCFEWQIILLKNEIFLDVALREFL